MTVMAKTQLPLVDLETISLAILMLSSPWNRKYGKVDFKLMISPMMQLAPTGVRGPNPTILNQDRR